MKDRKQKISKRWQKINIFFVLLIVTVLLFSVLREGHIFVSSMLFYERAVLDYKTGKVEQEINNRIDEIHSILNSSEDEFRLELESIINDVDHFASQAVIRMDESASLKEKREVYIDTIYKYDIFEDKFLFFSLDLNGIAWLMGLDKSDEGKDISDLKDAVTGDFIIKDMISEVIESTDGTAFYTYNYPKTLGGEPKRKTSYLKYNDEVELFIGTGVYYEDYLNQVKNNYINRLRSYYENSEEYVYLYAYDATPYVHKNPDLTKEQVLALLDDEGVPLHYELLEGAKNNDLYRFDYSYMGRKKAGVVHDIPEWEMYIGQSFGMDEVDEAIAIYRQKAIPSFIIGIFTLTVITLSLMLYIKYLMKVNFIDIKDEFTEQNNLVKKLSLTDSLTGLSNRKYFNVAYNEMIKYHKKYSVIVSDANGLKLTNDAFGHEEGDKLLVIISRLMEEVFGDDDIFRWGGDEFLVLSTVGEAEEINKKIDFFNRLASEKSTSRVQVSVSFGFAIGGSDDDVYDLMKIAEKMMYERKTSESSSQKRIIIDNILKTLYDSYNSEKEHSENVMNYSVMIGRAMDLSKDNLNRLRLGALFHDIGKITIPENIIQSTEKLSDEAYDEIKKHSEKGYQILQAYPELSEYAPIVYHHHEKYDGSGYPKGLAGKDIPLFSRIITVADAYDAMVEERPYKEALSQNQAIDELIRCKGAHFDPEIVDVFVNILQNTK